MNSPAQKESLPSIGAAGAVAIFLSLLGVLGSALLAISFLVMPENQRVSPNSAMIPQVRAMTVGVMAFFLALSVFGIFVGVGILRRKKWARITILVWGGFMTACGLMAIAFALVVFGNMPPMQLPNVSSAEASRIMHFTKIALAISYAIPAVIGIWWLFLFTRPRVTAAFTNPVNYAPEMDASGFPQLPGGELAQAMAKPSCPVPIMVIAGFLIFGAVCSLIFSVFPFPAGIPFFFLGHVFAGGSGRILLTLYGLIGGAAGLGLFKLKPWALHAAIGLQLLGLLNCASALTSPNYLPSMRVAMEKMNPQNSAFAAGSPMMSNAYFDSIMVGSMLFVMLLLAILLGQRSRFLAAASASTKP